MRTKYCPAKEGASEKKENGMGFTEKEDDLEAQRGADDSSDRRAVQPAAAHSGRSNEKQDEAGIAEGSVKANAVQQSEAAPNAHEQGERDTEKIFGPHPANAVEVSYVQEKQ